MDSINQNSHRFLTHVFSTYFEKAVGVTDSWRIGQLMFNELAYVKPRLAEKIRGTEVDPFYAEDMSDEHLQAFCEFINEHWDDP